MLIIIGLFIGSLFACDIQQIETVRVARTCLEERNKELKALESETSKRKIEIEKRINKDEKKIIINYIQGDSTLLDKALWNDTIEKNNKLMKKMHKLNAALDKLPSHRLLLHRGLTLPERYFLSYKKDEHVLWKGYSSTSFESSLYFVGNFRFYIIARNAKEIWPISPEPEEWEYLIPAKTMFKVLDIENNYYKEKKGTVHEILLKEI